MSRVGSWFSHGQNWMHLENHFEKNNLKESFPPTMKTQKPKIEFSLAFVSTAADKRQVLYQAVNEDFCLRGSDRLWLG